MLIPELIQRAVVGAMRFQFIESTITASTGVMLSSIKGNGQADPAEGAFEFHFVPRGPLAPEWGQPGGFLDVDRQRESGHLFRISGTERGSASWTARAELLRLLRTPRSTAVHGKVREWSRVDERSVHASFLRVVVPGRHPYPVTIRHAAGSHARVASVIVEGVKLEFRDHGQYTEISANAGSAALPETFADHAVRSLGIALEREVDWVYREVHNDRKRNITVRIARTVPAGVPTSASPARYGEFWQAYSERLAALL